MVMLQRYQFYQQKNFAASHGFLAKKFLLFDSNEAAIDEHGDQVHGNPRILAFGAEDGLKALRDNCDWFGDGTFDVTPKGFAQYYSIHCRVDKGALDRDVCPLHRCMCQYVDLDPTTIMTDFEEASINAFKEVWLDIKTSGCYFHLAQNQWNKLFKSTVGADTLSVIISPDLALQQQVKMVRAVAFVFQYTTSRKSGWSLLVASLDDRLRPFFEYFDEFYMGKRQISGTRSAAKFPRTLWNMFERTRDGLPQTNNSVEAFHKSLNTHFAINHPNMWLAINKMQKLQQSLDCDMFDLMACRPLKRCKPEALWVRRNNTKQTIVREYDNYYDKLEFLRVMALNLTL